MKTTTKPLKVGVVGCGYWGPNLIRNFRQATDCRSMNALRSLGIAEVLTNDRHFTQEGFTILFPGP